MMTVNQLIAKYPKIFISEYAVNYDIPDAWIQLVDDLCCAIQNHVDRFKRYDANGVHAVEQVICKQMKEKFGELRFYYENGNEYISGMVNLATSISYNMCIECSSRENLGRTKGWVTTMCKSCAKNNSTWQSFEKLNGKLEE